MYRSDAAVESKQDLPRKGAVIDAGNTEACRANATTMCGLVSRCLGELRRALLSSLRLVIMLLGMWLCRAVAKTLLRESGHNIPFITFMSVAQLGVSNSPCVVSSRKPSMSKKVCSTDGVVYSS